MDPMSAALALWALSRSKPRNPELVAYAVPSKGLGVVILPSGNKLVLGNGYAYEAHWTGKTIVKLIYGKQTDADTSLPWIEDVTLPHELMRAKSIAGADAIVIKYKTTVWVVDKNGKSIVTVDQGKFLGQNLLGSKEDGSAMISEVLKRSIDLSPNQAVLGIHAFC